MSRIALRSSIPAILLATCILLPFHDKAFTIDDTFFLRGASQAIADPLHPTAFDIVWFDVPERAGPSFGPLMSWLLVPALLSARPETVAHLVELGFLWLALLATVSLAIRLGVSARWAMAAGLLLAVTPTVLGMAGTAMADVPAMALGVAGMERLVAWTRDRRRDQALVAALLLGLAPVARPHAVLILGVAVLLLARDFFPRWPSRRALVDLVPVAGAVAVTTFVLVLIRDPSPAAPGLFGTASRMSSTENVGANLVAFCTHWVLALPLALPWMALRLVPVVRRWWVPVLATIGAYLLLDASNRTSVPNAVAAGLGFAALWDIFADGWSRRDSTQLTLGVWLLLPLVALPYSQFPAKLNLLGAPAAAIIVSRCMASRAGIRTPLALAATVIAGLALGVAILRADAAFAGLGRRAADEFIAARVAEGHRVWFLGHWGFQWYAEQAGGMPVTLTPPFPQLGDLVVISKNCNKGVEVGPMLLRDFRLAPVARLGDRTPGGRIMTEGAGFFSNNHGYLPWTWGVEALDEFFVGQVVATRRGPSE